MTKACILIACLLLGARAGAQQSDEAGSRRLMQLINQERAKTGAPALAWDDHLAEAAETHARLMVERKALSHQVLGEPGLRQRIAATGLRFNDDAENVAFDVDVDQAHDALMHSPGHRANILNPSYNAVGIAVLHTGNVIYIVEDFALRLPDFSDAEVAQQVLAEFNRERREAGLRELRPQGDLHASACEMARQDRVSPDAIHVPRATSLVAFTTFEPADLPSSLKARVHENFTAIAIGACYAKSPSYPSGTNWVAVAFLP